MTYNVQYSRPTDTKIAVSDWQEYNIKVAANSAIMAVAKVSGKIDGTFLILDCWEVKS